jgi:DNA-binding MarR family transcriptional regulator
MASPVDPADETFAELADAIIDIAREMRLRSESGTATGLLNQTQSQVMRFVHSHPGCLITDIARRAGIKTTNVSATIRELRDLGFVRTERDAHDGRATHVFATPEADRTLSALRSSWARTLAAATADEQPTAAAIAATRSTLAAILSGLVAAREDA